MENRDSYAKTRDNGPETQTKRRASNRARIPALVLPILWVFGMAFIGITGHGVGGYGSAGSGSLASEVLTVGWTLLLLAAWLRVGSN